RRSVCGRFMIKLIISKHVSFGPELEVAKTLIDSCILRWSDGANENLKALIDRAFQTDKTGQINTGRVLELRRINIENDDEWDRAMKAIAEAIRTTGTKQYIRFYQTGSDGGKTPISLDIANV
ncbi:MAG: DUF3164 family protein, partial [Cohaesibacteraceae bacterium]|nr:DUF3164 family protein [Cohaesibacteraceae bacterium]MBL4877044.1 DUF3164 family protein [Cohaesibacteraceae bacterium]